MTALIACLVFAVLWLGYANGANDNYKGVATLFGTGTSDFRGALRWATVTTFAGSLASLFVASGLVHTFSGKGLVADGLVSEPVFVLSVGVGAAATVFLASRFGIPISTTHGLTGALVGAGIAASWLGSNPGGVAYSVLQGKFLVPLLVSPFLATALTWIVYKTFRFLRLTWGIEKETCLCVGAQPLLEPTAIGESDGALAISSPKEDLEVRVDSTEGCEERYTGTLVGVDAQSVLDKCHYLSAGAVCFARGLNDTPKIVSLLLVASWLETPYALALVGVAIAAGGWIGSRKVAETMSLEITPMNHGQGFSANFVTAGLVLFASRMGVPVSTTHVSCGGLFGIGMAGGELRWKVFGGIVLAWVATLPLAALCSGSCFALLSLLYL